MGANHRKIATAGTNNEVIIPTENCISDAALLNSIVNNATKLKIVLHFKYVEA